MQQKQILFALFAVFAFSAQASFVSEEDSFAPEYDLEEEDVSLDEAEEDNTADEGEEGDDDDEEEENEDQQEEQDDLEEEEEDDEDSDSELCRQYGRACPTSIRKKAAAALDIGCAKVKCAPGFVCRAGGCVMTENVTCQKNAQLVFHIKSGNWYCHENSKFCSKGQRFIRGECVKLVARPSASKAAKKNVVVKKNSNKK